MGSRILCRFSATLGLAVCVFVLSGCNGCKDCPPPDSRPIDTSFTALDSQPPTCVYQYQDSGTPDSEYDLPSIYIAAVNADRAPDEIAIEYGASVLVFSTLLYPPPGHMTLSETDNGDTWTWTLYIEDIQDSGAWSSISGGQRWLITFSCGDIPNCCAETRSLDVQLDVD